MKGNAENSLMHSFIKESDVVSAAYMDQPLLGAIKDLACFHNRIKGTCCWHPLNKPWYALFLLHSCASNLINSIMELCFHWSILKRWINIFKMLIRWLHRLLHTLKWYYTFSNNINAIFLFYNPCRPSSLPRQALGPRGFFLVMLHHAIESKVAWLFTPS